MNLQKSHLASCKGIFTGEKYGIQHFFHEKGPADTWRKYNIAGKYIQLRG